MGPLPVVQFGENGGRAMAIVMNGVGYDRNGGGIVYLIDTKTGLPPVLPATKPPANPNLPAGEED